MEIQRGPGTGPKPGSQQGGADKAKPGRNVGGNDGEGSAIPGTLAVEAEAAILETGRRSAAVNLALPEMSCGLRR